MIAESKLAKTITVESENANLIKVLTDHIDE